MAEMKGSGFATFIGLFAGLCAIFAGCVAISDWYAGNSKHLHNDVVLLAIAVVACVASVELAKLFKVREAVSSPVDATKHVLLGLVFAPMGLFLTALVIYRAAHAAVFKLDDWMGVPVSLMFVFAGIVLGLPAENVRWRNLLLVVLLTCFALSLDWVAFAPGERKFSGSFVGIGFTPSAFFGRAVFGVFAIILDFFLDQVSSRFNVNSMLSDCRSRQLSTTV